MLKPLRYISFAALVFATLSGCTTRAWYEGLQHSARTACQQQPSSERARCEARLNLQDYATYQKHRAATPEK